MKITIKKKAEPSKRVPGYESITNSIPSLNKLSQELVNWQAEHEATNYRKKQTTITALLQQEKATIPARNGA